MWIKNKIIIHARTYIYKEKIFFKKFGKKVCGLKKSLYICNVIKNKKKDGYKTKKNKMKKKV